MDTNHSSFTMCPYRSHNVGFLHLDSLAAPPSPLRLCVSVAPWLRLHFRKLNACNPPPQVGLPANDTWLLAGPHMAAAARQALDVLALRGGPTRTALDTLRQLVEEGAQVRGLGGEGVHS